MWLNALLLRRMCSACFRFVSLRVFCILRFLTLFDEINIIVLLVRNFASKIYENYGHFRVVTDHIICSFILYVKNWRVLWSHRRYNRFLSLQWTFYFMRHGSIWRNVFWRHNFNFVKFLFAVLLRYLCFRCEFFWCLLMRCLNILL